MPRKKERPTRFVRAVPLQDAGDGDRSDVGAEVATTGPYKTLMTEVIGKVLAVLRKRFRVRQVDMAARLDWPQSVVSRVETGEINVTIDQLYGWCRVLDFEASRIGHEDLEVTPSIVLAIVDHVTDALFENGIFVLWGTVRLAEPDAARLTGRDLENFAVDHWPPSFRSLM